MYEAYDIYIWGVGERYQCGRDSTTITVSGTLHSYTTTFSSGLFIFHEAHLWHSVVDRNGGQLWVSKSFSPTFQISLKQSCTFRYLATQYGACGWRRLRTYHSVCYESMFPFPPTWNWVWSMPVLKKLGSASGRGPRIRSSTHSSLSLSLPFARIRTKYRESLKPFALGFCWQSSK